MWLRGERVCLTSRDGSGWGQRWVNPKKNKDAVLALGTCAYREPAGWDGRRCQSSSRRGRGMQELVVDEDRQPTNTVPRTIPEEGPIPLHRDTTRTVSRVIDKAVVVWSACLSNVA